MSISLTHGGLPDGVTPFKLCDLVAEIAPGTCKKERLSATAVRILQYFIRACRQSDFEPGKICGTWEQPQTMAGELRISTKVLHNAEAELLEAGFIERTHTPHARRSGKRHNGNIVALAGISLRPLIDGWAKWQARREAIEIQANAILCLKQEVAALNREVRASDNPDAIERAGEILPRGRVSRINDVEKLEALNAALDGGDIDKAFSALKPATTEVEAGRIAGVAADMWASLPKEERETTVLLAAGRAMRSAGNEAAQTSLRERGEIGARGLKLDVLDRVTATKEGARLLKGYHEGRVVAFKTNLPSQGFRRGDRGEIVDVRDGKVELHTGDGELRKLDPSRLPRNLAHDAVTIFEKKSITLHENDRIRWTMKDDARGLSNNEIAHVERIDGGSVTIKAGDGKLHDLQRGDPMLERLDLAYAINVHVAQGITAKNGIIMMNTRTVAIVSQKGGAGKTTLAIHLAAAATRAGQISLVIDTDPQASASQWAEWRQGAPPEIMDSAPPRIAAKIEAASEQGAELIVIDTPPHADLAASKAVECAELVLIPCRPSAFDLAAMRTTIRLVELLAKPAFVVFAAGPPNAPLIYADAMELVAGFGAQTCPIILPDRATYRHAVAAGQTVFDLDPSSKAACEIEQLHKWTCEQLNMFTRPHPLAQERMTA